MDPKRRTADAAALQETAAEDAMAAMLCSRERFEERPCVGYGRAQNSARGRARRSEKKMAHLVSRCRVGPGRGNLDHTLQFFVQTSGSYENVTRFAKFIHPLNVGLQFFFSFDTFSARPVLAQQLETDRVPNKCVRWCLAVIRAGVASGGALEGARAHRRGALSRTQGVRHRGVVA